MTVLSSILDRSPAGYDPEVAYLLSLVATWSYSEAQTLEDVLARDKIAGCRPAPITSFSVENPALPVDANGFLISYPDRRFHVLCFRGTEPTNVVDLLTDALVEPHVWRAGEEGWVHRGFFLSMDVLWPAIRHELAELEGDLYIAGHSLGGAIAVLTGRRFLDEGERFRLGLRGVYTFGQPMVGDRAFCDACADLPLYRHVYDRDLVPRLPPTGLGTGGYRHFGRLLAPGQGARERVWQATGQDSAPESCHACEILPAFLTLVTARTNDSSVPLALTSQGLRAVGFFLSLALCGTRDMIETVTGLPRLIAAGRLSLDDHIPTHYVDVSKASVPGKRSELAMQGA